MAKTCPTCKSHTWAIMEMNCSRKNPTTRVYVSGSTPSSSLHPSSRLSMKRPRRLHKELGLLCKRSETPFSRSVVCVVPNQNTSHKSSSFTFTAEALSACRLSSIKFTSEPGPMNSKCPLSQSTTEKHLNIRIPKVSMTAWKLIYGSCTVSNNSTKPNLKESSF